jgi:hypothetical protein
VLKGGVSLREIFSVSCHALLVTRKSERSIKTDSIGRDARATLRVQKQSAFGINPFLYPDRERCV